MGIANFNWIRTEKQEKGSEMAIVVQKFGGTSVADAEKIRLAAGRALKAHKEGHQVVVVASARGKQTFKRGGGRQRIDLDEDIEQTMAHGPSHLVELSDALDRMAEDDVDAAELVKLRLFAGMSVEEAGQALGIPRSTAYDNWKFARAWFASWLDESSA
jgi:DNA-directed RNA polymerase specialized sigma24 family protein